MPRVTVYSVKCCQCGHLFTLREVDIDPRDGPQCQRCHGLDCEIEAERQIMEQA